MGETIALLEKLIKDGETILNERTSDLDVCWQKSQRWESRCIDLLEQHVSSAEAKKFANTTAAMDTIDLTGSFVRYVKAKVAFLNSLREDMTSNPEFWKGKLASLQQATAKNARREPVETLRQIGQRFHLVAGQLRKRHGNRSTLEITDEYDVQDLMHALLRIFFDDVRTDERTPSYAGGSAYMDFLLKDNSVVIETKKTREGLKDREVGNQLIEDIARYKEHPSCRTFFCFVYDPDELIANPRGIERDLTRKEGDLQIVVFVAPRR